MQNNLIRGSAIHLADRAVWEFLKRTDNPPGMKRDEWLTLRGLMYSFDRVLRRGQVSDQAMRFVVISGGEPFMYKSDGKDLLDMVEAHLDMYFLVYTNGTQIDREAACALEDCDLQRAGLLLLLCLEW